MAVKELKLESMNQKCPGSSKRMNIDIIIAQDNFNRLVTMLSWFDLVLVLVGLSRPYLPIKNKIRIYNMSSYLK